MRCKDMYLSENKKSWMALYCGLAAVALATLVCLSVLAWQQSWFVIEDIWHFRDWDNMGPWRAMWFPIDNYRLPLHQLGSGLFYRFLGMHFGIAVMVMVMELLAGLFLLGAVLRRLQVSTFWSSVVLFVVACNVYVFDLFTWWSAGLHRFPYVAFTLLSLWAWLGYRARGLRRDAWLCLAGFLLALGFYAKAILVPGFLILLEGSLVLAGRRPVFPVRGWLGLLVAIDLIYALGNILWPAEPNRQVLINMHTPEIIWVAMQHYLLAWLPFTAHIDRQWGMSYQTAVALLMIGTFAVLLWYRRGSWPFVAAFFGVIIANAFLISISVQVRRFGIASILLDRYYFETIPISAVFLAPALSCINASVPFIRQGAPLIGAMVVAVGLAVSDIRESVAEYHRTFFHDYFATRQLVHKVVGGMQSLPLGACWKDSRLPEQIVSAVYGTVQPWSTILDRFPNLPSQGTGGDCFTITPEGDLRR